jgi:oligopeptide transport system permease protein
VTNLILRRLLQLPLILIAIYTITFTLAWLLPGNPLQNPEGRKPPPEVVEEMLKQYDLDNPWAFYFGYAAKATGAHWAWNAITGKAGDDENMRLGEAPVSRQPIFYFGPSLSYKDWSVNEILASSLPISVALGLTAILIALVIGLTAGVIGSLRPGSLVDLATLSVALLGISLPTFVTGTILLMVFGVWLGLVPVAGWGSVRAVILPAITLSLPFAAYIARLTRLGMIDVLGANYIRTARAKGLPEHRVILKHALKSGVPAGAQLPGSCDGVRNDGELRGRARLRRTRDRPALRQWRTEQGPHAHHGRGPRVRDDADPLQPCGRCALPMGRSAHRDAAVDVAGTWPITSASARRCVARWAGAWRTGSPASDCRPRRARR